MDSGGFVKHFLGLFWQVTPIINIRTRQCQGSTDHETYWNGPGFCNILYALTMNVLLIEDELKVANFISKGLEEEGYSVQVAYNGAEGLRFLKAD